MRKLLGVFNQTLFGFLLLCSGGWSTSNGPTNLGNNLAKVDKVVGLGVRANNNLAKRYCITIKIPYCDWNSSHKNAVS